MVGRSFLRAEDDRLPFEILYDNLLNSVVEKVAYSQPAADDWNLESGADLTTHIAECAVAEILEELSRLAVVDSNLRLIHLWVDMAVYGDQVKPSIVIEVVKSIPPPDD